MRKAPTVASFVADPVDHYVIAGKTVVWCKSPKLGGGLAWGRANADETRETTRAFEGLFGPKLDAMVDVVLDARFIEAVDPEALAALVKWLADQREAITKRVRMQIGVIPDGILGVTLAGILPAIGKRFHPVEIERDALTALRMLTTEDEAREVSETLEAALAEAMGTSSTLRRLRALARERCKDLVLEDAARALGLSTRTLQRTLRAEKSSFQDELKAARLERAKELVETTDEKVVTIAARIGVSETTLTELFRDRFGTTPAEHRRRTR